MFDPYHIGLYKQNYYYRRKEQVLRKKYLPKPSFDLSNKPSELIKLLPLIFKYELLSPLNDPPEPPTVVAKSITSIQLNNPMHEILFTTADNLKIVMDSNKINSTYFFKERFDHNNPTIKIPY